MPFKPHFLYLLPKAAVTSSYLENPNVYYFLCLYLNFSLCLEVSPLCIPEYLEKVQGQTRCLKMRFER